jgi:uncharacterized protein with GYD domain
MAVEHYYRCVTWCRALITALISDVRHRTEWKCGKGKAMPKYLFEANYVGDGIKGLMQEGGTKRREALKEALSSVGGSLESFYYAFGYYDVLGVFEAPDDASAAALSLLINSTGNVNVRLKPLLTVEDLDEAAKKTPSYRAPGQ